VDGAGRVAVPVIGGYPGRRVCCAWSGFGEKEYVLVGSLTGGRDCGGAR
jgi:hypothetical protein